MLECDRLVRVVGLYHKQVYAESGYIDREAKLFYPLPFSLHRFIPTTHCESCDEGGQKLVIENVRYLDD